MSEAYDRMMHNLQTDELTARCKLAIERDERLSIDPVQVLNLVRLLDDILKLTVALRESVDVLQKKYDKQS